jgi:hypothetical protein
MLPIRDSLKPLVAVVGVVVIVLSIIWIVTGMRPKQPGMDVSLNEMIGRTLAERAENYLGTGKVVVVVPVCLKTRLQAVETEVASFKKALKRSGKLEIQAEEKIDTPDACVDGLLTPDRYFRLVESYPDAKAIVSFAGVGYFREADLLRVTNSMPPICAVSLGTAISPGLVEKGVVRLAIAPRNRAQEQGNETAQSQGDSFSLHYQIQTAPQIP